MGWLSVATLNQINRSTLALPQLLETVCADSGDNQPMAVDLELVVFGHFFAQFGERIAAKLEQLPALLAMQMVVLRIAVIVFVDGSARDAELA